MYIPKNQGMRACVICHKEYQVCQSNQKYCSTDCYTQAQRTPTHRNSRTGLKLSSGTSGALSELIVCSDLLQRGYDVFRSVSQSATCDLIALKNGRCLRIEVRTGYRTKSGGVSYPRKPSDIGKSDITAVVLATEIVYLPDGVLV